LLNDATALTMYGIAIAVAVGGAFRPSAGLATFAAAMLGGVAAGLAVGWIVMQVRTRIEDTPVEMTISLLTPYAAFLSAHRLGVSGGMATVAGRLYLGRHPPRLVGAGARPTGRAGWGAPPLLPD